jgi:hypothetical protein
MEHNDDARAAKKTTVTAPSSAYEPKTPIYDGTSTSMKSTSGCSLSKTRGSGDSSNRRQGWQTSTTDERGDHTQSSPKLDPVSDARH